MTDAVDLRRKIGGAGELRSVVRTMKALAAANITQYEQAVAGLAQYVHTVEFSLGACLRERGLTPALRRRSGGPVCAVVFGSDQGLVGQFNETVAEHAVARLGPLPARSQVWAVGERVQDRLREMGLAIAGTFAVPGSVKSITALVGRILLATEGARLQEQEAELRVFYNRPRDGSSYAPTDLCLLPLNDTWRRERMALPWPTATPPQIVGPDTTMLQALIGEYLFASLFRASAESLASEQASRLAAMQRAERSIDELLGTLAAAAHRLRQSSIDEELFDVLAGFTALTHAGPSRTP